MSDILPKYSFFSWIRQGISSQITEEENLATPTPPIGTNLERASIDLKVKVKGNGNIVSTLDTTAKLIGPGDIIGLSQSAIVNTEPLNWITNFEPNYLPYIDFYDEDFPWRYTPAHATSDHKLRPWLFLVVLKEDEFTRNPVSLEGLLPSINVPDAEIATSTDGPFPNANEIWAWAHVHVNGDVKINDTDDINDAINRLNSLLDTNPDLAISRIISPRRLEENTSYYAFLIPSFETGRLAGLGVNQDEITLIPAQLASWGRGADSHSINNTNDFPVYYEWYFKTGRTGDFEYLVRQLMPRELDSRVGRRPMDIQDPGYLLSYTGGDDPTKGTLALEGALRIPDNEGEPYPWPNSETFRNQMQDLVNLGEDMSSLSSNYYIDKNIGGAKIMDDPIVAPPLYGRWHALKKKVDKNDNGWIHELNLDPRNRVVAGIGTSVIQKDQDRFMDMAWAQVGEVIEANKKLRWAQLAKEATVAMFNKHIKNQPAEHFIPLTAKMHKRIKQGAETIYRTTLKSALPLASESRAFRKLKRANGPILKRIDPNKSIAGTNDDLLSKMASRLLKTTQNKAPGNLANQTTHVTTDLNQAISTALAMDASVYNFQLSTPGSSLVPNSGTDNVEAAAFKDAMLVFQNYFKPNNWTPSATKPPLDVNDITNNVINVIQPNATIPKRVYQQFQFSESIALPPSDKIVPILAAPSFRQPMYQAIRDISTELLIPNLNLIPQNTISLLETNPKFIESYMVGINHEMGRELLWREYPTDQRGTYFKHFWDATDYVNKDRLSVKELENRVADIDFIHNWHESSELGTHNAREAGNGAEESKLVLAIRGDLLKKFPNAVIYAIQAEWQVDDQGSIDTNVHRIMKPGTEIYPIFGAKIEPDINFIGFDLTAEGALGDVQDEDGNYPSNPDPGWFFVIKERPGEPRFGADVATGDTSGPDTWDSLSWDHLPANTNYIDVEIDEVIPKNNDGIPAGSTNSVPWGNNAVNMAMILYQNPVLVAIHAHEMLKNLG